MDCCVTLEIVNKLDHPLADVRFRWLTFILRSIKYNNFEDRTIAYALAKKLLEWLAKYPKIEEKPVLEAILHIIKNFKTMFLVNNTDKLIDTVINIKPTISSQNIHLINHIKKYLAESSCSSKISESDEMNTTKDLSEDSFDSSIALSSVPKYQIDMKDLQRINEIADLLQNGHVFQGCSKFIYNLLIYYPLEVFLQFPVIFENLATLLMSDKASVKFITINCINVIALNLLKQTKFNLYTIELSKSENSEDLNKFPESLTIEQFCIKFLKAVLFFFKLKEYNQYPEFISLIYQEVFVNLISIFTSYSKQIGDIEDLAQDIATALSILRNSRNYILHNLLYFHFLIAACTICNITKNNLLLLELEKTVIDPILEFTQPCVHMQIMSVVTKFNSPIIKVYENIKDICSSLDSALGIIKHQIEPFSECLNHCMHSLSCLEILNSFVLIEKIIRNCSKVLHGDGDQHYNTATDIILKLLTNKNEKIKLLVYDCIHKHVKQVLGVHKISYFSSGFKSLCTGIPLNSDIIIEIACKGTVHESSEISNFASNILVMILKSNMTTSKSDWIFILNHIIPTLPILQCITNKNTSLGQNLHDLVNPDIANKINIGFGDILKSNIRLLFSYDSEVRQESISRLLYLLDKRPDSKMLLPNCTAIAGTLHSNLCIHTDNRVRLGIRSKESLNFHSVTAISPLIEILSNENSNPIILKSSVLQLSVILDDCFLHGVFSKVEDLQVILKLLPKVLSVDSFKDYSNAVIAIINILRKLCAYNRFLRNQLAECDDVLTYILRALFLLYDNAQLRLDCSQLLFMLCWSTWLVNDFNGLSGHFILENMHLPCSISYYDQENSHDVPSFEDEFINSDAVKNYIKYFIYWSWFNNNAELSDHDIELFFSNLNDNLMLDEQEITLLSSSSCSHMWKHYLQVISNAKSHKDVRNALRGLLSISNLKYPDESQIKLVINGLEKFMQTPPASKSDKQLFTCLLEFVRKMSNCDKSGGHILLNWFNKNLRIPSGPIINMIKNFKRIDNPEDTILKDVLNTIYLIFKEHTKFIDQHQDKTLTIDFETQSFDFQLIQQFTEKEVKIDAVAGCYRLLLCICYLDLSVIKELNVIKLVKSLINWLWILNDEKMSALNDTNNYKTRNENYIKNYFHGNCSLTLVRVLLVTLCNTIRYMKNNFNQSDPTWLEELDNSVVLLSSLCTSSDMFVRACAYQVLAGLLYTGEGSLFIMKKFTFHFGTFWFTCLNTLTNKRECILTRYQSGCCIVNLSSHIGINIKGILLNYVSDNMGHKNGNCNVIMHLLEIAEFSKSFEEVVLSLFSNYSEFTVSCEGSQKLKNVVFEEWSEVVPDLIRVYVLFMHNLTFVSPELMDYFHEKNVLNIMLKCVRFDAVGMDRSVEKLITAICCLFSSIITKKSNIRSTLEMDSGTLYYLTAILNSSAGSRYKVYYGILHLFSELSSLQTGRDAITMAIRQCDEETFLNTLCFTLSQSDHDELRACSLMFIINMLHSKTDQDFYHILNNTMFRDKCDELCFYRMKLIEILTSLINQNFLTKESVDCTHNLFELSVNCLSLCLYMLEDNSNNLFTLYKILLKRLNLLYQTISNKSAENLKKLLDKKRQAEAEEIKHIFQLLGSLFTNIKFKNQYLDSTKMDKMENSICQTVLKIMPFCLADDSLLNVCLECLHNYTDHCFLACRDMTNSALTLYARSIALSTEETKAKSIISVIINLTIQNNAKPYKKSSTSLLLSILKNSCQTVEGRLAIYKSDLLMHIKSKTSKNLPNNYLLWLIFLESFTKYSEGQLSIIKNNELLSILIASAEDKSKILRLKALIILRNISFNASNKTFLLNSKNYIIAAIATLKRSNSEEVLNAAMIIWNLLANNQKAKSVLKSHNVYDHLNELNIRVQYSSDDSREMEILKELLNGFKYALNLSNCNL